MSYRSTMKTCLNEIFNLSLVSRSSWFENSNYHFIGLAVVSFFSTGAFLMKPPITSSSHNSSSSIYPYNRHAIPSFHPRSIIVASFHSSHSTAHHTYQPTTSIHNNEVMQVAPMPLNQMPMVVIPSGDTMNSPNKQEVHRTPTATETNHPFSIAVTYTAALSNNVKFLGCSLGAICNPCLLFETASCAPLCNCLCWNRKLKNRSVANKRWGFELKLFFYI